MGDETAYRLNQIDKNMDTQHREVMENIKEIFDGLTSIKTTCAGCSKEVELHGGRLCALDDLKNGAVPKLQQDMSSLKTKVGIYAAAGSALVFAAGTAIKSIFFGK